MVDQQIPDPAWEDSTRTRLHDLAATGSRPLQPAGWVRRTHRRRRTIAAAAATGALAVAVGTAFAVATPAGTERGMRLQPATTSPTSEVQTATTAPAATPTETATTSAPPTATAPSPTTTSTPPPGTTSAPPPPPPTTERPATATSSTTTAPPAPPPINEETRWWLNQTYHVGWEDERTVTFVDGRAVACNHEPCRYSLAGLQVLEKVAPNGTSPGAIFLLHQTDGAGQPVHQTLFVVYVNDDDLPVIAASSETHAVREDRAGCDVSLLMHPSQSEITQRYSSCPDPAANGEVLWTSSGSLYMPEAG